MKEKLLLLAMAYPEHSKKYGHTVCMAGITEEGEMRRLYPIPYRIFRQKIFHKRKYIEYETRGKGDHRKESYKVYPNSIKALDEEIDYNDGIREICENNKSSIEFLKNAWDEDYTSLGIIKPKILDFQVIENHPDDNTVQTFLFNDSETPTKLDHRFVYKYHCCDQCHMIHQGTCLDTEAGQLYRKLIHDYPTDEAIIRMKEKFYNWMVNDRMPFFMMGTHSRYPNTWMIISVLYPKNLPSYQVTLL